MVESARRQAARGMTTYQIRPSGSLGSARLRRHRARRDDISIDEVFLHGIRRKRDTRRREEQACQGGWPGIERAVADAGPTHAAAPAGRRPEIAGLRHELGRATRPRPPSATRPVRLHRQPASIHSAPSRKRSMPSRRGRSPALQRSREVGHCAGRRGDGWRFSCGGFAGHVKLTFGRGTSLDARTASDADRDGSGGRAGLTSQPWTTSTRTRSGRGCNRRPPSPVSAREPDSRRTRTVRIWASYRS